MLTLKNNNIYYYNYQIFRGELSIPLFFILIIICIFNKNILKYVSYNSIAIVIIGLYDSYLRYKKYNLIGILIFSGLFHLPFLYPLINFKKYFKPTYNKLTILLLSLLIVNFLPYWPYYISRNLMSIIFVSVNLLLLLYYKIIE